MPTTMLARSSSSKPVHAGRFGLGIIGHARQLAEECECGCGAPITSGKYATMGCAERATKARAQKNLQARRDKYHRNKLRAKTAVLKGTESVGP